MEKERTQNEHSAQGMFALIFFAACTFLMFNDVERVSMSSSCDNFGMDIKGFSWYESYLFGELICTHKDRNNNWHAYVRQFGENIGRKILVQGSRGKAGQFAILDNLDGVLLIVPNGTTQKYETVQEAIEQGDKFIV
jgi:hypothetical protein